VARGIRPVTAGLYNTSGRCANSPSQALNGVGTWGDAIGCWRLMSAYPNRLKSVMAVPSRAMGFLRGCYAGFQRPQLGRFGAGFDTRSGISNNLPDRGKCPDGFVSTVRLCPPLLVFAALVPMAHLITSRRRRLNVGCLEKRRTDNRARIAIIVVSTRLWSVWACSSLARRR